MWRTESRGATFAGVSRDEQTQNEPAGLAVVTPGGVAEAVARRPPISGAQARRARSTIEG